MKSMKLEPILMPAPKVEVKPERVPERETERETELEAERETEPAPEPLPLRALSLSPDGSAQV